MNREFKELEKTSAAGRETQAALQDTKPLKYTKETTILNILRTGLSLNRFDAEKCGDHCLHSTIASLRAKGYLFHDQWEWVGTRFGREVHVKRYSYLGQA